VDLIRVSVPAEPAARPGGRPRPGTGARHVSEGGLDPVGRQGSETLTGTLLVVVGPGTGTTRTLVARDVHRDATVLMARST